MCYDINYDADGADRDCCQSSLGVLEAVKTVETEYKTKNCIKEMLLV